MSSATPFAGFNPRPSAWGYNWTADQRPEPPTAPQPKQHQSQAPTSPVEPDVQLANLPAALLGSLKRDKKPFTYTPGGVDLNEVLKARLQKRAERKKRYCEERLLRREEEELPRFESPKQLLVMPTHNTPLDMYSMENALQVLEAQAEIVANDNSLSSRSATLPRNFRPHDSAQQSKAFRVLQIMTDTEEPEVTAECPRHQTDEMRFRGIRDSKCIPSRFFHALQRMTGTEEGEEEEGVDHQTFPPHQPNGTTFHSPAPPVSTAAFHPSAPPVGATVVQPSSGVTRLKRPAAFLPNNLQASFRSVQQPNGRNPAVAVTDF